MEETNDEDGKIPISAAKHLAAAYGCCQVIIVVWDGDRTHITTFGTTVEDCEQAAMGGSFVKRALGWPELHGNAKPSRVRELEYKVARLEAELKQSRS